MTDARPHVIWRRGAWRIRRKLILLHTLFSLALGAALLLTLRPAVRGVVLAAQRHGAEAARLGEPSADDPIAEEEIARLYALVIGLLLAGYALIALALEVFILPRNVWRPIARLREADAAVRVGDHANELIPEADMPRDELGEIMRSRNESIRLLREHEAALARALEQLEVVASDLKRKNHLLEAVTRNMADQERLVGLGLMSAGLAHELNTPLAVLKGGIEEIAEAPGRAVDPQRARLLSRTVARLERLSENLLDFARVRPLERRPVCVRQVADAAWELVRADREAPRVTFENRLAPEAVAPADPDRLGQVFVNILRNAVDAMEGAGAIVITGRRVEREGRGWLTIEIADTGPGIAPEVLPTLFEPFITTRLDARGTGLGLAVSEGIVREHGGVILARNGPGGAVFEIMLPLDPPADDEPTP
ncbi:MAG: hypothetical protein D6693_06040 [Planctomycetota bacterium]|nr:MAG: hypothetical protein D6693_06040 [Planctomycetota bacterium]